jgi:hypothetical protein
LNLTGFESGLRKGDARYGLLSALGFWNQGGQLAGKLRILLEDLAASKWKQAPASHGLFVAHIL